VIHRRSPRPLSTALAPLQDNWAPDTLLAKVQRAWAQTVGDYIAAQARPVSERGGVLVVSCVTAAWAQELDLMAPDLTARLNTLLGGDRVTRLKCTVGA
jgi:predicted nucleic acid-binding Zn ribbon protein